MEANQKSGLHLDSLPKEEKIKHEINRENTMQSYYIYILVLNTIIYTFIYLRKEWYWKRMTLVSLFFLFLRDYNLDDRLYCRYSNFSRVTCNDKFDIIIENNIFLGKLQNYSQ